MEEKYEMDKIDDVILPGFRFHPTDEELVDFYLKRKIQQKSLPVEIIKQVDIYKYDPWDLPKEMASSGEKELYFYCQRDRKYRNSARPNRVTKTGFWKATGTDRPIYSSNGKCIGLKKSLVFYRGRASKGIKTEWMMHEFRLPSLSDSPPSKKLSDKTLSTTDSWAICRIFKKTNPMSMAQKAFSHSWIHHLPESMVADILTQGGANFCNQFSPENLSSTTENISNTNFSASDIPSYKSINIPVSKPPQISVSNGDFGESFMFSTLEASSSMLLNPDCIGFEGANQQFSGFSISLPQENMQGNISTETGRDIGFPFSLPDPDVCSAMGLTPLSY